MTKLSLHGSRNTDDQNLPTLAASILDDKRLFPRQRSVFRIARVSSGSEDGFARVLNISDQGLMLSIQLDIRTGSALQIDLSETIRLSGEVMWADGKNCGVRLRNQIDSAAILARLFTESGRAGNRPLRLLCSGEAIALGQFGRSKLQLEDVSLRGMKVQHDGKFREGLRVKIILGALHEREGVVRWCREGRAGVAMIEAYTPEDFGSTDRLGIRAG